MSKHRMEAFSDGMLAITVTIMVPELRPPHRTAMWVCRTGLTEISAQ